MEGGKKKGKERKEGKKKGRRRGGKKSLSASARNAGLFQVKELFHLELLEAFNMVRVYRDLLIEK